MRKKLFGSFLALTVLGSLVAAGPVGASDEPRKEPLCKEVFVGAATAPTLTVSVGGKAQTIDVKGIVISSIKVCVAVNVDVDLAFELTPIADLKTGCVGLTGFVALKGTVDPDVTLDVSVTVVGKKGLADVSKTLSLEDVPVGADLHVPLDILVCDP